MAQADVGLGEIDTRIESNQSYKNQTTRSYCCSYDEATCNEREPLHGSTDRRILTHRLSSKRSFRFSLVTQLLQCNKLIDLVLFSRF